MLGFVLDLMNANVTLRLQILGFNTSVRAFLYIFYVSVQTAFL